MALKAAFVFFLLLVSKKDLVVKVPYSCISLQKRILRGEKTRNGPKRGTKYSWNKEPETIKRWTDKLRIVFNPGESKKKPKTITGKKKGGMPQMSVPCNHHGSEEMYWLRKSNLWGRRENTEPPCQFFFGFLGLGYKDLIVATGKKQCVICKHPWAKSSEYCSLVKKNLLGVRFWRPNKVVLQTKTNKK